MKIIDIKTSRRNELIDITGEIRRTIKEAALDSGVCFIFCPHTTAGLTINENADPSVKKDILNHLYELVPKDKDFAHAEGNSDAHIKSVLTGMDLNIIIHKGELLLGTWQGIYFCEFDGPRRRQVYCKLINGKI